MAEVTHPLALDESLNSTETTPRNIADVLADELDGIKQAINNQSGSGNGHIIQNSSGANMPSENTMQFVDAHLSDDSVGGKTVVETFKAVTEAEYSSETEDGAYIITDGDGAVIGAVSEDYVEVEADGEKTWSTLLNELYALVDSDKVDYGSYLIADGHCFRLIANGAAKYFDAMNNLSSGAYNLCIKLSPNSTYDVWNMNANGNAYTPNSSNKPTANTKITLYYGNKKAIVDLQTTANRCVTSDGGNVQQKLNVASNSVIASINTNESVTFYIPEGVCAIVSIGHPYFSVGGMYIVVGGYTTSNTCITTILSSPRVSEIVKTNSTRLKITASDSIMINVMGKGVSVVS